MESSGVIMDTVLRFRRFERSESGGYAQRGRENILKMKSSRLRGGGAVLFLK